jgi:hypothetical protein
MINAGLFSSASEHWATPKDLYQDLDREFHFNDDPCPLNSLTDGLSREWGSSTYCNPPYGREILKWVIKALEESLKGKTVVMLVPSRTDTVWFQCFILPFAYEIRFLKGRLHFNESKNSAPFPSCIVVFRKVPND